MGWMPVDPQTRSVMGLPNEDADADRERKIQLAQQGQTSQEVTGIKERDLRAGIQKSQAETQMGVAQAQAEAQKFSAQAAADAVRDAARIRAYGPSKYAAGGAVKNDHPFNKSFDNKLLMKGRR